MTIFSGYTENTEHATILLAANSAIIIISFQLTIHVLNSTQFTLLVGVEKELGSYHKQQ